MEQFLDVENCLKVVLVLLLLPSVAFAMSVMSRGKTRRTTAPPRRAPGGNKKPVSRRKNR